ncbi:MAG: fibronectin type III domain-containing protein, partial [Bacteroidota bacterium]
MPIRSLVAFVFCLLLATASVAQTFSVTATSGPAPAPEAHVRLSWTPTGTPGELYQIRRTRLPEGTAQLLAVRPEADTTYQDTSALPGVEYRYCVTPATSATPEACAEGSRELRVPTNPQATDRTRTDGVAITWIDRSSVELGYVIFRDAPGTSADDPDALTPIDTTTADATGYLDASGVADERYQYCVGLLDDSSGTPRISASPEAPLACDTGTRGVVAPPTGVAASDGTLDDRVRVVWRSQPSVTFSIYRSGDLSDDTSDLGVQLASALTGGSYEDTSAASGEIYRYCVTASTDEGESVAVCDNGRRGALEPPTEVTASDRTSDSAVEIAWTGAVEPVTGYRIYSSGDGPDVLIGTVPALRSRFSDVSATPLQVTTYCVRSYAEAEVNGETVVTESASVCDEGSRQSLLPPTDFVASDDSTSTEAAVALAWETESDVVQLFQVFRDGTPIATLPPFARGYEDATGLSGTTYDYVVRAVAVVDLGPGLPGAAPENPGDLHAQRIRQGLAPVFARAEAARTALAAERRDAPHADLARLGARAEAEEAALLREIQDVLTSLGLDASGLTDSARLGGDLVTRDSDPDDGTRRLRAPDGLEATTDLEDRVRLTWTDRSEIEADYEVHYEYTLPVGAGESRVVRVGGPNRTQWVHLDVPAGVDVTYRVRATEEASGAASEWAVITGRRELLPPGRVTAAQDLVETELVVTWRDSSRAEDGYRVIANLASGWWTGETAANALQLVLPIQPEDFGTDIPVKVMAFSDEDRSVVPADAMTEPTYTGSAQVETTAMPALLPPRVMTASTGYATRVVVTWTDESSANDGYRVTRDGEDLATLGDETTYSDDAARGPATYCVTATTSGQPAADSPAVCATGRLSTVSAASTGDEVTTPRFSSALNAAPSSPGFGGGASYGKAVAAFGANAVVTTDVDAQTLSQGIAPGWAIPWADNATQFPYGTGGYNNGTVKGRVGMASFYERTESGWAEINRIQIGPNDPFTYSEFGYDADIHGDVAIIGAPGAAVFVRHPRQEASVLWWTRYQSQVEYGDGG